MTAVAIRIGCCEVVIVIHVAVRAGVHFPCRSHLVRTHQRPAGRGVVEGRRQKRDRVVTVRAVRRREWRSRCRMHWIVCPLPAASVVRIQMALGIAAVGRLDLQIVVVVDVAVGAGIYFSRWRQLMRIRQRETGRGVIKGRVLPGDRVMAI